MSSCSHSAERRAKTCSGWNCRSRSQESQRSLKSTEHARSAYQSGMGNSRSRGSFAKEGLPEAGNEHWAWGEHWADGEEIGRPEELIGGVLKACDEVPKDVEEWAAGAPRFSNVGNGSNLAKDVSASWSSLSAGSRRGRKGRAAARRQVRVEGVGVGVAGEGAVDGGVYVAAMGKSVDLLLPGASRQRAIDAWSSFTSEAMDAEVMWRTT